MTNGGDMALSRSKLEGFGFLTTGDLNETPPYFLCIFKTLNIYWRC
jgi:hypothetical protein